MELYGLNNAQRAIIRETFKEVLPQILCKVQKVMKIEKIYG